MNGTLSPYAQAMGIEIEEAADGGAPVLSLAFRHELEGRPTAWHGGAIAGLLETACFAALRDRLAAEGRGARMKPINVTVQYLSAGRTQASFALGRVVRLGRRSANVTAEAWQDDPARPIATAVMNIMMVADG